MEFLIASLVIWFLVVLFGVAAIGCLLAEQERIEANSIWARHAHKRVGANADSSDEV